MYNQGEISTAHPIHTFSLIIYVYLLEKKKRESWICLRSLPTNGVVYCLMIIHCNFLFKIIISTNNVRGREKLDWFFSFLDWKLTKSLEALYNNNNFFNLEALFSIFITINNITILIEGFSTLCPSHESFHQYYKTKTIP